MKKATILMSGVLALAIMAAVSIVLPSSIRIAQASPCSDISISSANEARIDCEFYGPVDIYVHSTDKVPLEGLPLPTQ